MVGIIGTLAEAKSILVTIRKFLAENLHLQVSDEKTAIKDAKEGIVFLSYGVRTVRGGNSATNTTMASGTQLRRVIYPRDFTALT